MFDYETGKCYLPACNFSINQLFNLSVCSGKVQWPVSNARYKDFGAEITLYDAYIDVGGQTSSLKPHVYNPGTFNNLAKFTTS